jgi:hypothetical protein
MNVMRDYVGGGYTAIIEAPAADTLCECGGCDWIGRFRELVAIGDAFLTPGDPSPAGRCPYCEALAYVFPDESALIDPPPTTGVAT